MRPSSTQPSPRTITVAAADIADPNGLKASIATSTSVESYSAADLDGVLASPGPASLNPPRFASVTTGAHAGTYVTANPIVVTGTYNGEDVTDELSLTDTDGGETILGDQPFDSISKVDVPAQNDTSGTFEFGVSDIAERKPHEPYRKVRAIGAGDLHVQYDGGDEDTFPMADGEKDDILPTRIFATGTAVGVKLYD